MAAPLDDAPLTSPGATGTEPGDPAPEVEPTVRRAGPARRAKRRGRRPGRKLFRHDRDLGVRWVAGADEAGRGCLAGPLVAAGVLLDLERIGPREVRLLGTLNDSKQQTEEAREALLPLVLRVATRVAVVSRCAEGIDRRGLHVTNLAALADALRRVGRPDAVHLVDGFRLGDRFPWEQRAVVDGDTKSAAIAAASIVAKVTRDRYMRRADAQHPGWGFASHVGYSTPEHRDAVRRQGVSPLHRLSFASIAFQQLGLGDEPL